MLDRTQQQSRHDFSRGNNIAPNPKNKGYVSDFQCFIALCEQNYQMIVNVMTQTNNLFQSSKDHSHLKFSENTFEKRWVFPFILFSGERAEWSLTLLESTPYTSLIKICQEPAMPPWVAKYEWVVRLYHDASIAEISSFQSQRPLKPAESLTNPHCHYKDEKNQVILFLNQWLKNVVK